MKRIPHLLALALIAILLAGCADYGTKKDQPASASQQTSTAPSAVNKATQASKPPPVAEQKAAVADDTEMVNSLDNSRVLKPFVVASESSGSLSASTAATVSALQAAGFEVAGQYSPVESTNIIVVTNNELKSIAAKSARGGYAAGQRVSVTETDGNVEVAYINPVYIQYAYHLQGDMQPVYTSLIEALGMERTCGGGNKNMTALKLWKYHYMMGMQYFTDPYELGSFASHEAAVVAVESGLAREGDALTHVYRIDIPGTKQTVFGVGMKTTGDDNKDLDSAFQMGVVDFEGCKKRAYFPYEVLVDGNNVEALHMRFRMAVHFPNLSMMGSHGFTKLMAAPAEIETALKDMVTTQ